LLDHLIVHFLRMFFVKLFVQAPFVGSAYKSISGFQRQKGQTLSRLLSRLILWTSQNEVGAQWLSLME